MLMCWAAPVKLGVATWRPRSHRSNRVQGGPPMCHSPVLLELLVRDRYATLRRLAAEARRREATGEPAGSTLRWRGWDRWQGMLEGLRRRVSFGRASSLGLGRLRDGD